MNILLVCKKLHVESKFLPNKGYFLLHTVLYIQKPKGIDSRIISIVRATLQIFLCWKDFSFHNDGFYYVLSISIVDVWNMHRLVVLRKYVLNVFNFVFQILFRSVRIKNWLDGVERTTHSIKKKEKGIDKIRGHQ